MTIRGGVHGNVIELALPLGLPDGQAVAVIVSPLEPDDEDRLPPGEGLRRAFGGWSDDPEGLDAYLEWNRRQRKVGRQELQP